MTEVCAWCGAPRVPGPLCPKCGANYEKAAQIKAGRKAKAAPKVSKKEERARTRQARFLSAWEPVKDVALERKLCLFAVPGMLAACFFLELSGIGDAFFRIVFGMPVHEMGHAVVGWFSGFMSIPTLWKTLTPDERGFMAPFLVFGALCYLINYARLNANGGLLLFGVALLVIQFIFTVVLDTHVAKIYVIWGGDGVGMMIATAQMIGFTMDKRTNWYKGYLRWGFAFIGAAAFADMAVPWWKSLNDISHVPYGVTGGTHTDTYKLVVYYTWDMNDVIHRYVYLSVICMMVYGVFYYLGIREASRAMALRRELANEDDREKVQASVGGE